MITIHSSMLILLGVFSTALVCLLLAPLYRRRAARMATDELKRSMPMTTAEIKADKDRLRAEFAISIHKLESKLEQHTLAAARQRVEINRRDSAISALEGEVARMHTFLDEHDNARRVLEQTITERLPKVEHRLTEAKKLLSQRDKEISELSRHSAKHALALEEATQINAQQRDEVHRLNATLTMHAARNRESLRDPRFDAEVALRAEIEALRAKARDQAALISRLQSGMTKPGDAGEPLIKPGDIAQSDAELLRLRKDLAEAELALKSVKDGGDASVAAQAQASQIDQELRTLKSTIRDQVAEIANLKAALKSYEAGTADDRGIKESKIALKARLSALQAQSEQQSTTIQTLRAEAAATNEKLARQAAHFMDEMRRLGAGTMPATGPTRRGGYETPKRASLTERITAPRAQRAANSGDGAAEGISPAPPPLPAEPPRGGFLRAVESSPEPATAGAEKGAAVAVEGGSELPAQPQKSRRPGLLERITGLDKPA